MDIDTTKLINQLRSAHLEDTQSTTALLNTDLHDVSQSTRIIKDNVPVTPEKRPVSGSSLDLFSFDQEEEEIDLEYFNSLLSKLPNNITTFHFINILSMYMKSLNDHHINISSDRFIITIYNQLMDDSFDFVQDYKLIKIIDIFINNPSNEAMKLANFLYFNQYKKQELYFRLWLIKFRKFNELKKLSKTWEIYLQKKQFNKIVLKYNVFANDLNSNALIFHNLKKTLTFYEIWKSKFDKINNLNKIVTLHNESKFFNKWINKMNQDYIKSENFKDMTLYKKFFKLWRLKKNEKSINTNNKLSLYLKRWISKSNVVKAMNEQANVLGLVLSGGDIFIKWKEITMTNIEKSNELNSLLRSYILRKYVKIWNHSLTLKLVESKLINYSNELKMKLLLKKWINSRNQLIQLNNFKLTKDLNLKRIVLNNWENSIIMKNKVEEFKRGCLKKYFKIWKLKTNYKIYESSNRFNELKKSKHLKLWVKVYDLKKSLNEYNNSIIFQKFQMWNSKFNESKEVWNLSINANEEFLKLRYLKYWENKYNLNKVELFNRLNYFQKSKYFNKLKNKYKKIQSLEDKAKYFYDNQLSIQSIYLTKWYLNYKNSLEIRLNNKLEIFKVEKNINLKRKYLTKWVYKNDLYLNKLKEYELKLIQIKLPDYLSIWRSKYDYFKEIEIESNAINNLNLLSSGFNKFQLKFLKIKQLNKLLNDYEEDINLQLIIKYLNLWSLKFLKEKRDYENIKNFRDRWDIVHLKSLLMLWKTKWENSKVEDLPSPSLFKTPVKSIKYEASIPGSEKIKRERFEKLKTRYKNVHRVSPLKTPAINSSINPLNPMISPSLNPLINPSINPVEKINFNDFISSPKISHKNLLNFGNKKINPSPDPDLKNFSD